MITPAVIQQALLLPDLDPGATHREKMLITRLRQRPPTLAGEPRQGAVLLLCYQFDQGQPRLIMTKRREDLANHPGQVAFPGGRLEEGETLCQAALRETEEEVGVLATAITLLGSLTPIYIPPSDFEVYPFVGWHEGGRPSFQRNANEVAELIEVGLDQLLDPACWRYETWQLGDQSIEMPYFSVPPYKVWGATAIILSEFLARLGTAGIG